MAIRASYVYMENNQVYLKEDNGPDPKGSRWNPVRFSWMARNGYKLSIVLFLMLHSLNGFSQKAVPESISVSYLGEMVTHPGLKLSFDYPLTQWERSKKGNSGVERSITKTVLLGPSIGAFYHRRYQTGLMVIPELKLKRQNQNGGYFELGAGFGYMRTFIPNTFEVGENDVVSKTSAGHDYWAKNVFMTFGKEFKRGRKRPMGYFIKPQFVYATPNFPKGVGYFMLEIGMNFKLK